MEIEENQRIPEPHELEKYGKGEITLKEAVRIVGELLHNFPIFRTKGD